jgi:atypical dual specificity phosphatase
MRGFSWVDQGRVAGMPKPGDWNQIESDLEFLKTQGIRLLFTLTETPPDSTMLARFDIASVHLPVEDFCPPSKDQLFQFVRETRVAISQGRAVGVHCRAGIGRTGTFLAAWLIAQGMEVPAAIAKIRSIRPGSIETREQEQSLHAFARALRESNGKA